MNDIKTLLEQINADLKRSEEYQKEASDLISKVLKELKE